MFRHSCALVNKIVCTQFLFMMNYIFLCNKLKLLKYWKLLFFAKEFIGVYASKEVFNFCFPLQELRFNHVVNHIANKLTVHRKKFPQCLENFRDAVKRFTGLSLLHHMILYRLFVQL